MLGIEQRVQPHRVACSKQPALRAVDDDQRKPAGKRIETAHLGTLIRRKNESRGIPKRLPRQLEAFGQRIYIVKRPREEDADGFCGRRRNRR